MKLIKIFACLSSLTPLAALACGPWIPTPYIVRNDRVFFNSPRVGFLQELEHVLPPDPAYTAVLVENQAPNATEALLNTLHSNGIAEPERTQLLGAYQHYRQLLNDAKALHDVPVYRSYYPAHELDAEHILASLKDEAPPAALPDEFRLYLDGARYYYLDNQAAARKQWQALLDLPRTERQHQTVRAAFMLAKTEPTPTAWQRVRELVADGFDDPDGLAAASYGREAQHALQRGNYPRAAELYLAQYSTGYWNAGLSLQRVANEVWLIGDDRIFASLVNFDNIRAVLTADLLTRYDSPQKQARRTRLLNALPSPKAITVTEAGRFALLEYQQNNLSTTRHWLAYADADDALALWVRSKLLLRDGHIDEGRTLLVELLRHTAGEQPDWDRIDTRHAWGELGLLYLKKENYAQAANCFANAHSWLDLAYVLERVMTVQEAQDWALFMPKAAEPQNEYDNDPRQLIARRLMREAQFRAALPLFPEGLRAHAEAYISAMQQASNAGGEARSRAQQYWTAARLVRDHGMELFGAELEPDFAWSGGTFDWPHSIACRINQRYEPGYEINTPTHAEEDRVDRSAIKPDQRFHYRYRAAQLAELAAGLLPNNDENAARIYCIAGSWIKNRDPYAADRFYKQLVVRCPETALGKQAAELHWFPDAPESLPAPFES
ncbi:hypothetical protein [Cerasicoccus fimbriatus]|uniref:hypothetical protein n=1 Tax=Cerasicoccus fimbriatus TaxID=3014554 RepID=UPI0022B4572E|nr:hypothetical protein [Cerasicoccus sp. TK19100]